MALLPNAAVLTLVIACPALAFIQTQPIDLPWFSQAEHLGMVGILSIAVWVLWTTSRSEIARKDEAHRAELGKKDEVIAERDEQLIEASKTVTAAVLSQAETNREMRKVLEESVRAMDMLRESLIKLPCVMGELEIPRPARRG